MKYIIGFIAVLVIVLIGYSMLGKAPKAEAPAAIQKITKETINNKTNNTIPSVSNAQKETSKKETQQNKKETMTEQNNTITKATLKTNQGDIIIEFDANKAPKTVANFIKLAKSGFYDGVKFHRVIKGFMIQGGDPLSKVEGAAWGTGGPGYKFEDELPQAGEYKIGSVAMANSGPNTNGSQFFIVTGDAGVGLPPLYSLFGQITAGMDTVHTIENTATEPGDKPVKAMVIESIVLE